MLNDGAQMSIQQNETHTTTTSKRKKSKHKKSKHKKTKHRKSKQNKNQNKLRRSLRLNELNNNRKPYMHKQLELFAEECGANIKDIELCMDPDSKLGCNHKYTPVYDRTAAVSACVKPCGIIVDLEEILGSEGPTVMSLHVWSIFQTNKDTIALRPRMLKYDSACKLAPSVRARLREGNLPETYSLVWDNQVLGGCALDAFHAGKGPKKGHIAPTCVIGDPLNPNPECLYHPDLPRFIEFRRSDVSKCEGTFRHIGPALKSSYKHSNESKGWMVYVHKCLFNEKHEMEMIAANQLEVSGVYNGYGFLHRIPEQFVHKPNSSSTAQLNGISAPPAQQIVNLPLTLQPNAIRIVHTLRNMNQDETHRQHAADLQNYWDYYIIGKDVNKVETSWDFLLELVRADAQWGQIIININDSF